MNRDEPDTLKKTSHTRDLDVHQGVLSNGDRWHAPDLVQLLQNIPAALYTCDRNGYITMFNEAAVNLWGRRPELGKDLWCGSWKIYHLDGRPMPLSECPMAIALKESRPVNGHEIIVEQPDGNRKYVLPQPRPLFDSAGQLIGAVNLLIDITELRETHAKVAESEARFRTLAENTPVAVWMLDRHANCIYLNPEWSRLTGQSPGDGLRGNWLKGVHPDDRSSVLRKVELGFRAKARLDFVVRYLDRSKNYIKARIVGNPQYNKDGDLIGYIGTLQDVSTEDTLQATLEREVALRTRKIQEQSDELRRSEERYHRMVSEVEDYAIILLNKDGIVENWNKGAEKIKGYKADEIVGKSFRLFYTTEDRENGVPEQLLKKARLEGRSVHEGWRMKNDGSTFWGSIVITALHDDDGTLTGFSKVTRDLTEKKIAEEELSNKTLQIIEKNRELESMNQELASFAYVSSHDLQEPLRKIQTFASRIVETEHENLSPKGKDYFIRMQNAALRMQTLIEDLLTYSRTNTSDKSFEPVDLNKLVADIKMELRESIDEKHAVIECESLPTLNIITFQFRQLITNLLSNALKFSKPDQPPHVRITTEVVKGNQIANKAANPKKTYHHIAVADNGIGFEPEHRQKIFEVFQRLHGRSEYTGTGIGLAICKKVVENHGGFISADSLPDQGATFHVYIPQI